MKNNKYLKFIPTYTALSIYDIDFNKLYESGKRIILFDLDNTLISYRFAQADTKLLDFRQVLKEIGFKVYVVSNNNDKRISEFSKTFELDGYLKKANKPYTRKLEIFISENDFNKDEIIYIGDQLVTDIKCANNASIDSVLVSTIDKSSQKWYTKINRLREKKIINKIAKNDSLCAKRIENIVNRGKSKWVNV